MPQTPRSSFLPGIWLIMSAALVSGCGSGSDPAPVVLDPVGDETPDVPVDGPVPDSPLINAATARTIAAESLELVDTLVYVFSNASGQLVGNDSLAINCGSGSVEVSTTETSQTFQLGDCAIGGQSNLGISGQVVLNGTFDSGFAGSQSFSNIEIALDNRVVSVDGSADVVNTPDTTAVTGMELQVDDSQSLTTLSQSTMTIINGGSDQQSVQMSLTADSPRFGLAGARIESSGLNGVAVSCPQSGNLTVSAEANGLLVVNGAVGSNLTFTTGDTTDTLACTEVVAIVEAQTEITLTPPPAPGGL